jgi:hypothetical protein
MPQRTSDYPCPVSRVDPSLCWCLLSFTTVSATLIEQAYGEQAYGCFMLQPVPSMPFRLIKAFTFGQDRPGSPRELAGEGSDDDALEPSQQKRSNPRRPAASGNDRPGTVH